MDSYNRNILKEKSHLIDLGLQDRHIISCRKTTVKLSTKFDPGLFFDAGISALSSVYLLLATEQPGWLFVLGLSSTPASFRIFLPPVIPIGCSGPVEMKSEAGNAVRIMRFGSPHENSKCQTHMRNRDTMI